VFLVLVGWVFKLHHHLEIQYQEQEHQDQILEDFILLVGVEVVFGVHPIMQKKMHYQEQELVVLEVEEEVSLVQNTLVPQVLLVILDLALLIRVVVEEEEHISVLVVPVVLE
jgi:hypothetical protein